MTKVAALFVEICVFKYIEGIPKYLILKRSRNEKIYPGIYQFITGTIEIKQVGDDQVSETAVEAALREVEEEIHVRPEKLWAIPMVNQFYVSTQDVVNLSPMFLAEIRNDAEIVLSMEHDSYNWCEFDEGEKLLTWGSHKRALCIVHNLLKDSDDWGQLTSLVV